MARSLIMRIGALAAVGMLLASCASMADQKPDASPVANTPINVETPPQPAVPPDQVLAAVAAAQNPQPLPPTITPANLQALLKGDTSLWAINGCNPGFQDTSISDIEPCLVGKKGGSKTLVVIGDSNAAMWAQSFNEMGKREGWQTYMLVKNNCGPAAVMYYTWSLKRDLPECNDFRKWSLDQIRQLNPAAVVLIGWYGGNTGPDRPLTPDMWTQGLIENIKQLPAGVKPILIGNQPHVTQNPGQCLSQHSDDVTQCGDPASVAVDGSSDGSAIGNAAIKAAADATGGLYVDVTPWFCGELCPQVIADMPAYSGQYHINNDYGRYLSGAVADTIRPFIA